MQLLNPTKQTEGWKLNKPMGTTSFLCQMTETATEDEWLVEKMVVIMKSLTLCFIVIPYKKLDSCESMPCNPTPLEATATERMRGMTGQQGNS